MNAEDFRAQICRVAHAPARAKIIQIAGDKAHARPRNQLFRRVRRLLQRRFRMLTQKAGNRQNDRRLTSCNAFGVQRKEIFSALRGNQRALHGAGRAGRICQIQNRHSGIFSVQPLKHNLKVMRRASAGTRQLTMLFIKLKHLRYGERAVVAGLSAEGNVHRHNNDSICFRQLGRNIAAGLRQQDQMIHIHSNTSHSSG